MTTARFAFTTWNRDIEMRSEFVNRECFAHDVDRAELIENFAQLLRRNSVDFQIPVFWLRAHQLVTHTAADKQRAPALGAYRLSQLNDVIGSCSHCEPLSGLGAAMSRMDSG